MIQLGSVASLTTYKALFVERGRKVETRDPQGTFLTMTRMFCGMALVLLESSDPQRRQQSVVVQVGGWVGWVPSSRDQTTKESGSYRSAAAAADK